MIEFKDVKDKIIESLKKKVNELGISSKDGYELIDGFFRLPIDGCIQKAYLKDITMSCIFCVGFIDKSTGLIYHFSLKSILPEIDLNNLKI